jgi:L-threonylcarbamoyladenylate synthase
MKVIKIDLDNFSKKDIEVVAEEIRKEKVVVLPTDTIYGLSAIATSKKAIRKIYRVKKRKLEQQKHLILLVKSFCMVRRYCFLSKKQHDHLKGQWTEGKRALTVILRGRRDYFQEQGVNLFELISDDDGVAVRRPNNKFLLELIKVVDEPIVSTSLNITGQPDLKDISQVEKYFKDTKPDIIIDAGKLPKQKPSRLEDLRDMQNIKVYRE